MGTAVCCGMNDKDFIILRVFPPYLLKRINCIILNVSDPNPKTSTAINMSSNICRNACFGVILYSSSLMKI